MGTVPGSPGTTVAPNGAPSVNPVGLLPGASPELLVLHVAAVEAASQPLPASGPGEPEGTG